LALSSHKYWKYRDDLEIYQIQITSTMM
jgi:hypothetical protein